MLFGWENLTDAINICLNMECKMKVISEITLVILKETLWVKSCMHTTVSCLVLGICYSSFLCLLNFMFLCLHITNAYSIQDYWFLDAWSMFSHLLI